MTKALSLSSLCYSASNCVRIRRTFEVIAQPIFPNALVATAIEHEQPTAMTWQLSGSWSAILEISVSEFLAGRGVVQKHSATDVDAPTISPDDRSSTPEALWPIPNKSAYIFDERGYLSGYRSRVYVESSVIKTSRDWERVYPDPSIVPEPGVENGYCPPILLSSLVSFNPTLCEWPSMWR